MTTLQAALHAQLNASKYNGCADDFQSLFGHGEDASHIFSFWFISHRAGNEALKRWREGDDNEALDAVDYHDRRVTVFRAFRDEWPNLNVEHALVLAMNMPGLGRFRAEGFDPFYVDSFDHTSIVEAYLEACTEPPSLQSTGAAFGNVQEVDWRDHDESGPLSRAELDAVLFGDKPATDDDAYARFLAEIAIIHN